jgi:hypothetical protein
MLDGTLQHLADQSRRPDTTIVVDNDPAESARPVVDGLPGVRYLAAGDNLGPAGGIALALREVLSTAQDDDLVLLVDDGDPPPDIDSIERVSAALTDARVNGWRCAGAGIAGARFRASRAAFERVADQELTGTVSVDYIGGGQCPIYRVDAIRSVDDFDGGFFFGFDDADFGLRLRRAGWALVVPGEYWLDLRSRRGRIGATPVRSSRPMAPWRQYYSARNVVHLARRYGTVQGEIVAVVRGALTSPARSLVVHHSLANASASVRGTLNGLRGELGRTEPPA